MARTKATKLVAPDNDEKLAVGYARVSTQEQASEGVSLEWQKDTILAYMQRNGLVLDELLVEEGVSASVALKSRPEGKKIFDKIKSKGVKYVVAAKLDRMFRDTIDCLSMIREWEQQGVKVLFVDLGIDFTTPTGRAFLTNAASFAELERNLISTRTRDGLEQVKKEGIKLGGEAWGWRRTQALDEKGRFQQKVVVEELEVVVKIKKLREDGYTFQGICDTLAAEGIQTKKGGKWWPMTVRNICDLDISEFKDMIKSEQS